MSDSNPFFSSRPMAQPSHQDRANALRFLSVDAVEKAKSGHPGMPMGMADVAAVLFQKALKFDVQNPLWPDRDRFIISNGHGSMLLYALAYLTGYPDMTLEQLKAFRQLGSHTAGHPEVNPSLGIETTTGPLGQGLGNAVGMALAERILNAQFGDSLVDHKTYVFVGDGCLMEGLSQEAISLAGHLNLSKLTVFFDNNAITIDGSTDLSVSDNQRHRFEASNWHVQEIDGHDPLAIEKAIEEAGQIHKPSLISCKTTIGFGSPGKAGTSSIHGSPLGEDECQATRQALGWNHAPFHIPDPLLDSWRAVGNKGTPLRKAWEARLKTHPQASEFINRQKGEMPEIGREALNKFKETLLIEKPTLATRKLSEKVLEIISPHFPALIGGSADLTGSNNTKASTMEPITKDSYKGSYIYYGVREHGMAAAMNGLALHGGFVPYGGTFLVFSDYCRPAIRLTALMKQHVIYVMTHDSIGLGEDGPTHQPIEHLASLRAIPNVRVYRPADGIETAECWESALSYREGPSIIVLTRQSVPSVRVNTQAHPHAPTQDPYTGGQGVSQGAYVLAGESSASIALIATGSEVSLALDVMKTLTAEGLTAKVISAPCLELFDQQPQSYHQSLWGEASLKVAIEAGSPQCWHHYVGTEGLIIGMDTFGASAPYKDLMTHFGFTADQIRLKIHTQLREKKEQS